MSENVQNVRQSHKICLEIHERLESGIIIRKTNPSRWENTKYRKYSLSAFLFIIAMMPFNCILRKFTAGNKYSKSQEKINDLMYIDDIKIFAKKILKRTGEPDTNNKNIYPGYSYEIWHRKMSHTDNKNGEKRNN